MAASKSQNDENISALSLRIETMLSLQDVPNSTLADATPPKLSDTDKKYITHFIIPYLHQVCRDEVRPSFNARQLTLLIDISEKPSGWKKSFTTHLDGTEREDLQICAHMWLQHELVDDRDEAKGSKPTPEENERRSSATLQRLYKNNFQELCSYWHSQEKLKKYVFHGKKSTTFRPNHDVRYDYFKTCLHRLRNNLRVLLRYNLVAKMPSRTNSYRQYTIDCFEYRTGENWLIKSLNQPIEELLRQNGDQLPEPEPREVRWPGDNRNVQEPPSSLKNVFTREVTTKQFKRKLINYSPPDGDNRPTFKGKPLSDHHIISKEVLLQLFKKLNDRSPESAYPQIDNRFDNVVNHNYRKYNIVDFWKKRTPGAKPKRYSNTGPPDEFPENAKILLESGYLNYYGRGIIWVEGNLFAGPSPELRGPFDPSMWKDSSFEEDARPILGTPKYVEFRILRDSIREFVDLEEPTYEQTDQIRDHWLDVFWRYHHTPMKVEQWIERSPTKDELKRLKRSWQNNLKRWAIRGDDHHLQSTSSS